MFGYFRLIMLANSTGPIELRRGLILLAARTGNLLEEASQILFVIWLGWWTFNVATWLRTHCKTKLGKSTVKKIKCGRMRELNDVD